MSIPTDVAAALARLALYNYNSGDPSYNFGGAGGYGYVTLLPQALNDTALASNYFATIAETAVEAAEAIEGAIDGIDEAVAAAGTARDEAVAAKDTSVAAAGVAGGYAGDASDDRIAAQAARAASEYARDVAASAAGAAGGYASTASGHAEAASDSADASASSAAAANAAKEDLEEARDAAAASAGAAADSKAAAAQSAIDAEYWAGQAEAIAGGGVTSVGLAGPVGFTFGSPVTSTGNLTFAYDTGYEGFTTALKALINSALQPGDTGTSAGKIPVLDGSGKISTSLLPESVLGAMSYKGGWNASTNSPAIPAAASGNKGWYYVVTTAGSTTISGVNEWKVGDWIVSNGTTWDKVDSSDQVNSVAGLQGTITGENLKTALAITTTDISGFSTNGRSLVNAANYAAMRGLLDLEIGIDVQAYSAILAAFAGLTGAAGKLPYFTGASAMATADLTSFARTLLAANDQSGAQTVLGISGGGAGLVPLGSMTTVSSPVAAIAFTLPSGYKEYVLKFWDILPSNASGAVRLRTSTNGGSSWSGTSGYSTTLATLKSSTSTLAVSGVASNGYIPISDLIAGNGTANARGISGEVRIINPSAAKYSQLIGETISIGTSSELLRSTFAGETLSSADVDAVQIIMDTGNIQSGFAQLYGVVTV